jgi:uncharacterized membrane protein YkgB
MSWLEAQRGTATERLRAFDERVASVMEGWGHLLHRVSLGAMFVWFGSLKLMGFETATGLLSRTIYWGPEDLVVALLGAWEMVVGLALIHRPLIRLALLLLVIRLPATALALILEADVTFAHAPLAPTPEGQFLIKDLLLFGAALVIGGTVRGERPAHVHH